MKKIFSIVALLAITLSASAQLAWDTEFTKDDFNNALTVISKTENVNYDNPTLGLGGGLKIGKIVLNVWGIGQDPFQDECVIALPQVGIAEKLTFAWQGGSDGSLAVYQSVDHNNWTQVYTAAGNTISSDTEAEVALATTTRYLKFYATGKTAVAFRKIKVTELKSIACGVDEWEAKSGMVDDAPKTKTVNVNWTNIVAEVSSTDSHFTASLNSIGQKNLINQTTQLTITYSHAEAGQHSGEIVIAGENREVRIAVSGETKKYDQTLSWNQTLGEHIATDYIELSAYVSSNLDVVWVSSDTTIAKVENNVVKIRRSGTVDITATQPGNYKFNAATPVKKTLVIHKADPVVSALADEISYGQRLCEVVLHENSGVVEGTFQWRNIDTDTVLNAGDYILDLLFTPTDTGIYNLRTLPVALRVNKAVQTIVWEEQDTLLTVGVPATSTAVLSSGLPVTYAYTACLLTIEGNIITPEQEGEVTVVAYHPGNENYLPTTIIMQVFNIEGDANEPTDIPEQLSPEQMRDGRKFLHAGKVYISYGGRTYDAEGKRL